MQYPVILAGDFTPAGSYKVKAESHTLSKERRTFTVRLMELESNFRVD
jgi:hypothetical protein